MAVVPDEQGASRGRRLTAAFSLLLLPFLTLSCGQRQAREDANPAPSSYSTRIDALFAAGNWADLDRANRNVCEVRPTGSMAPAFDSRSILLRERVRASDLRAGDWASYLTTDGTDVTHKVVEVRPGGILFDGINNNQSDGWIPPDRVRWRVAGILFTQR